MISDKSDNFCYLLLYHDCDGFSFSNMLSFIVGDGDSGRVVIWNMAPIRDEKDEADAEVPKVLCQMDSHLGKDMKNLSRLEIIENALGAY